MGEKISIRAVILVCSLAVALPAFAAQEPVPNTGMVMYIKDARTSTIKAVPIVATSDADLPAAVVNGDAITVDALRSALGSVHSGQDGAKTGEAAATAKIDLKALLERLINVQLVVQEGKNIGLDELPEVKNSMAVFSQVTLRDLLRRELWKDLTAPDSEVEKEYRKAVREVKTTSVFFAKAANAKKAAAAIKKGKKFDDVVAKALKNKTAEGSEQSGETNKFKELDPAIAKAIAKMKVGGVSSPIKIKFKGKQYFVLFRYDGERFPDDQAVREQARKDVLDAKRVAALRAFITSLNKKYATRNKKLYESIDYGPKGPGVQKLLDDKRVIVEIRDAEPVTVGDLSEALLDKFYHGMKDQTDKKIKKAKLEALEALVQKRLLYSEALRRGLDKTPEFRNLRADYERNLVFGEFVQRVVSPGLKVTDEDLQAYYKEHAAEFKSEPLLRVENLVFKQRDAAVAALDKMKKGADITWIRANAPGQVGSSDTVEPTFEDHAVPLSSLPEDVQGVLADAKADEARLYASKQGQYHVLYVKELVPPQQLSFEQVRSSIGSKAYYTKLNRTIEDWIRKLKKGADITIYLSDSARP
jgi:parvulin-like peptidyl-prolyl isomerase